MSSSKDHGRTRFGIMNAGMFSVLLLGVIFTFSGSGLHLEVSAQESQVATVFTATFEAAQAVPPPTVPLNEDTIGAGVFSFNPETSTLTFQVSLVNLTSSVRALQFHNADTGEAGAPIQTICGEGPAGVVGTPLVEGPCKEGTNHTMQQSWTMTADQVSELFAGRLYVNVHTESNFAPGEIRGQVNPLAP